MDESSGIDFRPTPEQRRFFEGGRLGLRLGQRNGRALATELFIVARAASPEEAKLCLEDLQTHGFAFLSSDGKRVEPPHRNGARFTCVKFDEEKK